ncbi:AP-1 complex subunit sigma [Chondrus crispus]|uniref:AP complex subunit sigma n=1 Tax=Chondrus crispus TaxID=2769 RepID=R7QEW2_CHOCR|nr:AP-1 complex subunit sigma [Chondrus crispus]CDF37042.1 AP-1 complex subunit sigma [Chondrus crispus]|eukprot:XP_005716861.1 AP-1 complex subunit sigma [Chondrus crispus]
MVLPRTSKMCNVVDRADEKVVYKRYASLYFVACTDRDDNELLTMELLHMFVEVLDSYFGNVCELDLIFNFTRSYWVLDEIFISGELQECSKAAILAAAQASDAAAEPVPEFGPRSMQPPQSKSSARRR